MANNFTQEKFNQVLSLIESELKSCGEDSKTLETVIIPKLRLKYSRLGDDRKNSDEFLLQLKSVSEELENLKSSIGCKTKSDGIYVLIKTLLANMQTQNPSTAPKNLPSSASDASTSGVGSVRQRQAKKKLEGDMNEYEYQLVRQIKRKKLEELTLDDLDKDDNAYTLLERLEQKAVRVAKTRAKDRKEDPTSASFLIYRGSGFESIDKAVTKLIRPTKSTNTGRAFDMPSWADVEKTIKEKNAADQLNISDQRVKEICVEILQHLRLKELENFQEEMRDFGEAELVVQPEAEDQELEEKLKRNETVTRREEEEDVKLFQERKIKEEETEENGEPELGEECRISDSEETSDENEQENEDHENEEDSDIGQSVCHSPPYPVEPVAFHSPSYSVEPVAFHSPPYPVSEGGDSDEVVALDEKNQVENGADECSDSEISEIENDLGDDDDVVEILEVATTDVSVSKETKTPNIFSIMAAEKPKAAKIDCDEGGSSEQKIELIDLSDDDD